MQSIVSDRVRSFIDPREGGATFRDVLRLAIPVSVQSLVQSFLGMVDQIMVGQLGEVSVAAAGIGNKPSFILIYALSGITAAASIFASQYAGAAASGKDSVPGESRRKLARVMRATLLSGFALTAAASAAVYAMPALLMSAFTADPAVRAEAVSYLLITSTSFLPLLVTVSCSALLRSTGRQHIPLVTGFSAVVLNTTLNAVFIFGFAGIPAMGLAGAAVATAIARFAEAGALLVIMKKLDAPGRVGEALSVRLDKGFPALFFASALPAVCNELLWALGDSAYAAIYGRLGTHEIAGMTLTYPVVGLTIGFFSGFSAAAGIMVGGKLGSASFREARCLGRFFFGFGAAGAVLLGVLVALFAAPYASLFRVDPAVRDIAVSILLLYAIVMWVKVSNMIVLGGVIRSGGQTRYTLVLDILGTWGIGVPLGLTAAFALHLPVQAVYALIAVEECVRLSLALTRMRSGKWMVTLNG